MSDLDLLHEYLTKFFPILLFIFVALAFGVLTLVISYFDAVPGAVLHFCDVVRHFRYRGDFPLSLGVGVYQDRGDRVD